MSVQQSFICTECGETFPNRKAYYLHLVCTAEKPPHKVIPKEKAK